MATVVSRRPGGLRVVPLDALGHLHVAAVTLPSKRFGFGLVWRFPAALPFLPNPHAGVPPAYHGGAPNRYAEMPLWQGTTDYQREVLAAARIDFAPELSAVQRVADVALDVGTREGDAARTAEAMSLFRNLERLSDEAFEQARSECLAVVQAYWTIAEWLAAPSADHPPHVQAGDAFLVLR